MKKNHLKRMKNNRAILYKSDLQQMLGETKDKDWKAFIVFNAIKDVEGMLNLIIDNGMRIVDNCLEIKAENKVYDDLRCIIVEKCVMKAIRRKYHHFIEDGDFAFRLLKN